MKVLVVEDDDRVARALGRTLRWQGFEVHRVTGVAEALRLTAQLLFDVALVDLGLDDGDGIEVIKSLRKVPETAVIAVTARGAEADRVRGLRSGADDYIVKPFGAAELMARIEAVQRRVRIAQAVPTAQQHQHGELLVDRAAFQVRLADRDLGLTPKELEIFDLLARNVGHVVPRQRILDQVWQTSWEGSARTLDTHMASLRGKLGEAATISTIRGVGYRLEPAEGG